MKQVEVEKPLLINADTVASLMGVSEVTIWRLVSAGRIPPGIKLGGSRKWNRSIIERFINEGCPALVTGS